MAKKKHGGSRPGSGRKQAHPEGLAIVVTASVPSGLVNRMDVIATHNGWKRSEVVTEAIRVLLKRYEGRTRVAIPSAEGDSTDSV